MLTPRRAEGREFEPRPGHYSQARTQGGVRWVRTNPPLRIQLQNDSAPFLNKLSINNREFDYR